MKHTCLIKIARPAALLVFLFASGCTTVVRENIISDINTGIGASLTENQKTQMYELKLGFIRTQFYSIPTGKKVKGEGQSNSAEVVPNLVSGIRTHSGIEHLFIGMDVSENFAVGNIAVNSQAAVAMYLNEIKNTNIANSIRAAVTNTIARPEAPAAHAAPAVPGAANPAANQ